MFDGTQAAQKALSALARTGQIFGVAHAIDVLTGNETDKIRQNGHDRIPTFGVEFSQLHGVGGLKASRYGPRFLEPLRTL